MEERAAYPDAGILRNRAEVQGFRKRVSRLEIRRLSLRFLIASSAQIAPRRRLRSPKRIGAVLGLAGRRTDQAGSWLDWRWRDSWDTCSAGSCRDVGFVVGRTDTPLQRLYPLEDGVI